ncbi:MAG: hypothetical protein KDK12_00475 [Rhodobacteraceae bacterium]|nr:hypothetical protein [Paracoccaceae bacterium]
MTKAPLRASLLSAGLILAAFGHAAIAADGTTLTTVLPSGPTTIDPPATLTGDFFPLINMMVESLTKFDSSGALVPSLATEWSSSADGLVWTFSLRDGVSFTDGTPFNAEAVKFSLDRLLSSGTTNTRPGTLAAISAVDVIDDLTVRLTLSRPFAALPAALSLPNAAILSPTSVTTAPNTMALVTAPVGTGPYQLDHFSAGDELGFIRNDNYWGDAPYYERQVYLAVPEEGSRLALLRSGEADIIAQPPVSEIPTLLNDPEVTVTFTPTSYMIQMIINTVDANETRLQDPAVRRALSYAIDRRTIIDRVLFGAGVMPQSPLAASVFGACPAGDFSYDPDRARQLLADAGASDLNVQVIAPSGRYLQAPIVAQAVAGYLRDVGVNATMGNAIDWATYVSTVYRAPSEAGDRDLALLGFGASYNDPSQALSLFQGSNIPPNGFNASYFDDARVNDLMSQALVNPDQDARADLYCQVQQALVEQAPSIWLYAQSAPIITSAEVTGIDAINLWFVTTYAHPAE